MSNSNRKLLGGFLRNSVAEEIKIGRSADFSENGLNTPKSADTSSLGIEFGRISNYSNSNTASELCMKCARNRLKLKFKTVKALPVESRVRQFTFSVISEEDVLSLLRSSATGKFEEIRNVFKMLARAVKEEKRERSEHEEREREREERENWQKFVLISICLMFWLVFFFAWLWVAYLRE